MKKFIRLLAIAAVLALTACASSVKHDGPAGSPAPRLSGKVAGVAIELDEKAKKLHAENLKFNPEALRSMVQRALELKGLVAQDAPQRVLIEVTDMRIRSHFTAVLLGIFAGSDSVEGNVLLRGANDAVLARYVVSASYGLGGYAGGQDEARMNWLYEEFAKQTVNALTGEESR